MSGRVSITHVLMAAGGILVLALCANFALLLLPAMQEARKADADLENALAFEATLTALQRVSAERGPANLVMTARPADMPATLAALSATRAHTDAALKAVERHLAEAREPGSAWRKSVADTVEQAEAALDAGRREIDAYAASPPEKRDLATMSAAIARMFYAFDALYALVPLQQRAPFESGASATDSFAYAAAVNDLREFAGRLGSLIVPPVAARLPIGPAREAEIQRVRGQIDQILRSLPPAEALGEGLPASEPLRRVNDLFVAEGLSLMDRLREASRDDMLYGLDANELTKRYVPTMAPLDDLRSAITTTMMKSFETRKNDAESMVRLFIAFASATAVALALLPVFFHRLIARPMLSASRKIIQLAADQTIDPTSKRYRLREIADLFAAIAILNAHLRQRRDLMGTLRERTERDALTGVMSRSHFEACAREMLEGHEGGEAGLLYIDIDNFKTINDTRGHHLGDRVLFEIGQRLRPFMGERVLIGRLGGDEFAVCASGADRSVREALALRISEAIGAIRQADGQAVSISASIGLSDGTPGPEAYERLCREADRALYRAKAAGRNTYAWHGGDERETAAGRKSRRMRAIRSELTGALARREFRLDYQPIVDLGCSTVVFHEALLRWHHPELGTISPKAFVPLLECDGGIREVGHWALAESLRTARDLPGKVGLSVNVSPWQLDHPGFPLSVAKLLADSGVNPARLQLEITESAPVFGHGRRMGAIGDLRRLGVRVVLDDIGAAFASLSMLRVGLFDGIKVERAFLKGTDACERSKAILMRTCALAEDLELDCVVEGIETAAQLDWLKAQGVRYGQGFYLGRPTALPAAGTVSGISTVA